jgi:hypothetical protein
MPLPIFPRKGVELSTDAEVIFDKEPGEIRVPAIRVEFENGDPESRARVASGDFVWSVGLRMPDPDKIVLMDFLYQRLLDRSPFTFTHPDFGTATAWYDEESLPFKKIIRGTPRWWGFDIKIRARI